MVPEAEQCEHALNQGRFKQNEVCVKNLLGNLCASDPGRNTINGDAGICAL